MNTRLNEFSFLKLKSFFFLLAWMPLSAFAQLDDVPVKDGPFEADWDNLSAWQCPEWFRDAKFGIWAHWDPQCEAEDGDWYARSMYSVNSSQWNTFKRIFGAPPSRELGYKDLCDHWKADKWDPEALIQLYADAGAKYFMTMGQHHDNFDCWDSPYQEWNSMHIGPMKDIVGGWVEACRRHGLKVGVSMHGAHAWTFFEVARDYDASLTLEDGLVKEADGTFKYWWHGLDPQELYAQNHAHSADWSDWGTIHRQWGWGNGVCPPSVPYMQKFQNRVLQCIDKYNPDMLYFDDTVLPFYGASTNKDDMYSLNILKHFYNHSAALNDGQQQVVVTGKILNEQHKQALLWDVERGIPDRSQDLPWQTCTCIGGWHYSKSEADRNAYKTADQVIRMLVDIVSKNGNLLLSIPVRGNGTLDANELRIVAGIKAWMDINKESIYATRPWKVYGEGPLFESTNPLSEQGFNEGINYSAQDVRYVERGDTLFATIMCWPSTESFTLKALGMASPYYSGKVQSVHLLGYGELPFSQGIDGLELTLPQKHPNEIAPVMAITFDPEAPRTLPLDEIIVIYMQKAQELLAQASNNTGKPNPLKVELFNRQIDIARQALTSDEETRLQAAMQLHQDYITFCQTGYNPAGTADDAVLTDITLNYLLEKSDFSATEMGSRFGRPVHWTVENFSIPQRDASRGTKNGIDNYPGTRCLMLGKWSGEDGSPAYNMTDARIFRSVRLPAGHYRFSFTFNALYQLGAAYIYVAATPLATSAIARQSIANLPMSKCAADGKFYSLNFTLDEEQDVVLVFQANMQGGNSNQEFRVQEVKLQYYDNPDVLTQNDLTVEKLIQSSRFSRISGQSTTTRYGTPAYWTVENYTIPTNEGTRHGLDRYPGYDCLTLGVWDDREKNTDGDLSNARLYRTISLPAGRYYFGATYEANYQLAQAYIFASNNTLRTSDIPTLSLAYDNILDAGKDNATFRGIYFELPDSQNVVLGFQANLLEGPGEQEFRASRVMLVRYGNDDVSVTSPHTDAHSQAIYDLSGRRLINPSGFIQIVNGTKVILK